MYFYNVNVKLFEIVWYKRLKKKSWLPRSQIEDFWYVEFIVGQ